MLILFLLLVLVPLAEIAAFIIIGEAIGLWLTLLTVIVTALAGGALLRQQGLVTAQKARQELAQNRMPMQSLFDGLCLFAAGLLLLTPGFITDFVGFILFIPTVRTLIASALVRHLQQRADFRVTVDGDWQAAPDRPAQSTVDPQPSDPSQSQKQPEPPIADDPNLPPVSSSRWGRHKNEDG